MSSNSVTDNKNHCSRKDLNNWLNDIGCRQLFICTLGIQMLIAIALKKHQCP